MFYRSFFGHKGSLSFPTCLPLFSPSSAPRALATAASARAARVGTLRHSAPSAASSCFQWGRRYRKLAAVRFKLKHAGKRLRVIWYVSFDSIKLQEQQTQTDQCIVCENRNWLSQYRFQKLEAEEDTNIFYVENRSRKLHCLSPLATQYSSFYPFCMLCPFGHFSVFLEIWPIILGTRCIFLFFNSKFSSCIGETSSLLEPSCRIRREMKNNHPRRPEGRQQIQQRPFWHLLYLHGDHEEALTRFSTSACFKRHFTIGHPGRLLTFSGRVFSIFGSPPTGAVRSMPLRTQRNRITILQVSGFFPLSFSHAISNFRMHLSCVDRLVSLNNLMMAVRWISCFPPVNKSGLHSSVQALSVQSSVFNN